MLQNLQNFAKFQEFQLDNLVDFEKCCKTRIFLQKSVPIQPKTSNILPKFCQKLATTLRVRGDRPTANPRGALAEVAGGLRWLRAEVHALAQAPGALHSASSGRRTNKVEDAPTSHCEKMVPLSN